MNQQSQNSRRGTQNFSVTSTRDGSRSFNGSYSDRWKRSHNNRGPKNRGYRGNQRGSYRNFNAHSSRFRSRQVADGDGDVSMSGDSVQQRMRDRYNRGRGNSGNRRGFRGRGRGRQPVNEEDQWFKVMIPYGACMTKDEFVTLIQNESGGLQFTPVSYHISDQRSYFYVKGCNAAESLRVLSGRPKKPDGRRLVMHVSTCEMPQNVVVTDEDKEKLKLCMSSRYDPSTRLLNLSSIHTDDSLTKDGIFLYLNKPGVMSAVVSIVGEYIPELLGLDLSNNKLLSLNHVAGLVKAAPGVTSLNLGKNQMRSINELEKLKGWGNIMELVLEGNDFCNNFKNQMEYVSVFPTGTYFVSGKRFHMETSAVRKKMPKVVKLDGNDLPPPVSFSLDTQSIPGSKTRLAALGKIHVTGLDTQSIPGSKGSYFMEEKWRNLIVTFVKEYYSIYDSDSRRNLMAAYAENAQFSMCVLRNSTMDRQDGFRTYIRESRNLKKIGHIDSDELAKKVKTGMLSVVSSLESLPKTTHDMNSFTVDVTLATPMALCFVLHGVFKESENPADKPVVRSFSRTFVTIPKGDGISIINDMLTISNAGLEQSRKSFKGGAPTPSSSPTSSSQTGVTVMSDNVDSTHRFSDQQKKMVESFSAESGMNTEFSFKCLQENAWNYQQAAQVFTNLKNQGKIPPEAFVKT